MSNVELRKLEKMCQDIVRSSLDDLNSVLERVAPMLDKLETARHGTCLTETQKSTVSAAALVTSTKTNRAWAEVKKLLEAELSSLLRKAASGVGFESALEQAQAAVTKRIRTGLA